MCVCVFVLCVCLYFAVVHVETESSALVGTLGTSAVTLASCIPGWASAARGGVLVGVPILRRNSGAGLEEVLSLVVVRVVVVIVDCSLDVVYYIGLLVLEEFDLEGLGWDYPIATRWRHLPDILDQ